MNDRGRFYLSVVSEMIEEETASILVCGGGILDKTVFLSAGFTNVTISNLDDRINGDKYLPYNYKYENAEHLSFENEAFDFVVTHAVIHHASSPHKVLTEMYRVAKKGVLAFEARDSFIIHILQKLNITPHYEHVAVYGNDCKYGGVNNTAIPNYIYRWTEREIEKTIKSFAPHVKHSFVFRYSTAFPCCPALEKKSKLKILFLNSMRPFFWIFTKCFPKQQNLFAFFIPKPLLPNMLHPWLKYDTALNVIFDKEWGDRKYRSS
jgi:SAM-dependent methyltransferase